MSKCVPCSARYRQLVAQVASHHPLHRAGHLYFLTLTAPGERAHQRWRIDNVGPVVACPCHEFDGSIGGWNATASKRWNRLRTALRRIYPGLEFFRAVEPQKRGFLHLHPLLWSPDPVDPYVVQRLALEVGFGCNMTMPEIPPGSNKHAYYVSKYVSKGADQRADVPWVADWTDKSTGETFYGPTTPTYRTWSISQGWGIRMKDVTDAIRAARERALARSREELMREDAVRWGLDWPPTPVAASP